MIKHKDFLGQPITVGDEVVYIEKNGRKAVKMCRSIILRLTPKRILVDRNGGHCRSEYQVCPAQVVKIDPSL